MERMCDTAPVPDAPDGSSVVGTIVGAKVGTIVGAKVGANVVGAGVGVDVVGARVGATAAHTIASSSLQRRHLFALRRCIPNTPTGHVVPIEYS
jgi:hypothetical protein